MTQSYYSINNPRSKSYRRRSDTGGFMSLTPRYVVWWAAFAAVYLWFVLQWCMTTDFMPLTRAKSTYVWFFTVPTLFTLPSLLSRRWWVQSLVMLVLIVFLEANLMYCRTYLRQIPLDCYALAANLRGFEGSVLASLRWGDVIYPIIWIAASLLGMALGGKGARKQPWGIPLVLIAVSAVWLGLVLLRHPMKQRIADNLEYTTGYSIITPLYTPFGLLIYEAFEDPSLSAEEETRALDWLRSHEEHTARYAATLREDSTKTYPLRTLLVLVESLESWPIGLKVGDTEVTPNLNRLVADSTVYYNPGVVTQVRGGRSIDAQLLYLAGMYPITTGVYSFKCQHFPYETLATEASRRGVTSYLYSSDRPVTWNGRNIDTAFGIDSIYMNDSLKLPPAEVLAGFFPVTYDGDLVDEFLRRTEGHPDWNGDGRALGLIVTLSSHGPFRFYPEEFRLPQVPEGCGEYLTDYLNVVHYVDHCLGTLVDSLQVRPGGERTMIAITGDHEAFESRRDDLRAEFSAVDAGQHTPLILINSPFSGRDSQEIGQVDVHAALLEAAGFYSDASWRGMGVSPWDPRRKSMNHIHDTEAQWTSNALLLHPELWRKYRSSIQ